MAQNRRRFGDRKEGRLLRSLPGFAKFIPFIMPQRNDRCIHYEESFEITPLDRRLRALRVDGYKGIGILHFLIAAYIRCISMLPGVNRFVVGRRIYARNNIEIVMTVKRSISLDATETTIKVQFEPTDTIFDVYRKMNEKIEEIKTSNDNNNTEDVADFFARMPRFLLRFARGTSGAGSIVFGKPSLSRSNGSTQRYTRSTLFDRVMKFPSPRNSICALYCPVRSRPPKIFSHEISFTR